jgi:alcohol dehydrogenase (cytochrome c)
VPENNSLGIRYLINDDPRGSMGLAGTSGGGGATGLLTTAGKLLFAGDGAGNIVAFDPANGAPLWHARVGGVAGAPETYMLDERQYLLVSLGDALAAFALYGAK